MLDVRLIEPETTRPLRRSEYEELTKMGAFEGERVELLSFSDVVIAVDDVFA